MTSGALAQANLDFATMEALQTYHDAVNSGSDPAVVAMLAHTTSMGSLGAAIQAAWVSTISSALSTATSQFASDPAT